MKCNDCGVQLFVRGKEGIKRFYSMIGKIPLNRNSRLIIDTIDYFNYLKEKLIEIEENKPIFGVDEDLNIQEKIIKMQLNLLRKKLN